jgi:hypothetical protein
MRTLAIVLTSLMLVLAPELGLVQPAYADPPTPAQKTSTTHKKKPAKKAAVAADPGTTPAPAAPPVEETVAAAPAAPNPASTPAAPPKKSGGLWGWLKGPGDTPPAEANPTETTVPAASAATETGSRRLAATRATTATAAPPVQPARSPEEERAAILERMPDWRPVIDTKGVNMKAYARDFDECRVFAVNAHGTDGGKEGVKNATKWGLGYMALLGAATVATGGAALIPYMAGTIAVGGGAMAIAGGAQAKYMADAKFKGIVMNCLSHRGYSIMSD